MATIEQNYDLLIAIDEGFNSGKIVVNGITFKIPTEMFMVDENLEFIADRKSREYIGCTIQNTKYIVGANARTLLNDSAYKKENVAALTERLDMDFLTSIKGERFLVTCIGLALIKYDEYTKVKNVNPKFDANAVINENSQWNIYLIIGYPHEEYMDIFKQVKPRIVGRKQIEIELKNKTYTMDFTINDTNVMTYSQAIAAYVGYATNDKGEWKTDEKGKASVAPLPCLVIDGGQKTVGIYMVTTDYNILHAESNQDFAMNNVYEAMVDDIKEAGRDDILVNNISEYINSGKDLNVEGEDGRVHTIDVREIYDKRRNEYCDKLIEYINKKFNKMLDISSIIVTGGTGVAYFERFKNYVEEFKTPKLAENTSLTKYEFLGKEIKPENAIAVGLYKVLSLEVPKYKKKLTGDKKQSK